MSNWRVTMKRLDKNHAQKTDREFVRNTIASILESPTAAYQDLVGKIVENNGVIIQFTGCRPVYAE